MKNLNQSLEWRYAIKKFDTTKKVSVSDVDSIIRAGNLAPTAYGLQPFRIINVTNKELREKLLPVSYNQIQVTDASTLLVIARRTDINEEYIDNYIKLISDTRGIDPAHLEGFKKTMVGDMTSRDTQNINAWSDRQSYIALGIMIAEASALEIDSAPMEGFVKEEADNILGLSEYKLESVAYLALGYRDITDEFASFKKVRLADKDFSFEI